MFFGEAILVGDTKQPVPGEFDVIGIQLPTVHRRLVVPVNTLTDVEDIGQRVRLLPSLNQMSL